MNILFMAKETSSSIPALKYLLERKQHVVFAVVRTHDKALKNLCGKNQIPVGSEDDFLNRKDFLPKVDYLLSFYWKLVRPETLNIPTYGCINFHPGPLPEARGSGYHVAILGRWGYWGVTAHWMDTTFDTGAIIRCNKFSLPDNIFNCDLVDLSHKHLYKLFVGIVDDILSGVKLPSVHQDIGTYYSKAEMEMGKRILSTDTQEEIDLKIRAYWHPPYMGANILIKGKEYALVDEKLLRYISQYISAK